MQGAGTGHVRPSLEGDVEQKVENEGVRDTGPLTSEDKNRLISLSQFMPRIQFRQCVMSKKALGLRALRGVNIVAQNVK